MVNDPRTSLVNPYQVGSPARKYFFGRDELLDEMEANVGTASPVRQNYAVVGPRQIGKTSVVLRLRDRLCTRMPVSYLTLQMLESRDQNMLFRELLKPVKSHLEENAYGSLLAHWYTFDNDGTHTPTFKTKRDMEALSKAVLATPAIPRVVFIIDEAESLQEFGGPSFLGFLRSIMQSLNGLAFIAVGSQSLSQMVQDYTSPFYNVFLSRKIGRLSRPAAVRLVRRPAEEEWGISFTDGAVEHILAQSGNHPHLIRLLCYEVCEYLRKKTKITLVDEAIVHQVGSHLVDEWIPDLEHGDYFSGIWEVDPWARLVMIVLAWADGPMRFQEMRQTAARYLEKTSVNLESSSIFQALRDLQSRLIVRQEVADTPSKRYLLSNDLLEEWVRAHCDLDLVLEEIQVPEVKLWEISPARDLESLEHVIHQRREKIKYLETRLSEATNPEELEALSLALKSERRELQKNLERRKDLKTLAEELVSEQEIDEDAVPDDIRPEIESLRRQIDETEITLRLIEERQSVLATSIPLHLIKEKRRLQQRLSDLQSRLRQLLATASKAPETPSAYDVGLGALGELLKEHNPEVIPEFLILESRLRETLSQERLYGSSENTRRERARIVYSLNVLAMEKLGVSFNELAAGRGKKK
jgi:hypothetical protein